MKRLVLFTVAAVFVPALLLADQHGECSRNVTASVVVDQGNPWRAPFGLDRIGSLPVAHVQLSIHGPVSTHGTGTSHYYLLTYGSDAQYVARHELTFAPNPSHWAGSGFTPRQESASTLFAHVALSSVPREIVLEVHCKGRTRELAREPVAWPEIEADAVARPNHLTNPVDLGTVLPPHDWLLLGEGQPAIVDVVVISHARNLPNARLRASFDRGKPVEVALPLVRNQRAQRAVKLSPSLAGDRAVLRLRLTDGERELWGKDIRTMIVAPIPNWPSFGAVETTLRYDAPIPTADPKTGIIQSSIDYRAAWDDKFKDVVVFLPNGSRFVFWRGANYIPFWAGRHNTGALYQWSEDCSTGFVPHPDGSRDCPEPLFDSELRYSRVRVIESSASRIHVRWDYQPTDSRYEVIGARAAEDFFFYPDGFGTRVVTVPSARGTAHQLSEFIIVTPQAAYPLEVLPQYMMEVLSLDGGKERIKFPFEPTMRSTSGTGGWALSKLAEPREGPMIYRLLAHKDDSAGAIYFHPSDPAVPKAYPPFYDKGELVTPAYWGNHWPLTRGKWTGWSVNDQITVGPAHNSVAGWFPRSLNPGERDWEVKALTTSERLMPDARGPVRSMDLLRFAWMIAYTDLSDEALRDWGKSFSVPPALEVAGVRLDVPSYSLERRALRLVAEQPAFTIKLRPMERTINPVLEIVGAPKHLVRITVNDQQLPPEDYAWDGLVLWIKAAIGPAGATVGVEFRSVE